MPEGPQEPPTPPVSELKQVRTILKPVQDVRQGIQTFVEWIAEINRNVTARFA